MTEIGIRALKQNASTVIAAVASGQTMTVTDRGRPVASISPIRRGRLAMMIEAGRARPAKRDISQLPLAAPAEPGSRSLSDTLREMRDDERP